ncbi:MAG: hypothetical protein WBP75_16395 [Candidatus Cybelea sp.]
MKIGAVSDTGGSRPESRVFAAIALIALPAILSILPSRYQMLPKGIPFLLALALVVPMLAAQFARNKAFWTRIERAAAAVVLPLATCFQLALLAILLRDMAKAHSNISGMTLLTTSIAIWATNILVFSLAYWQVDRGGPGGRVAGFHGRADLSFSHGDPSDNFPADWRPIFADYFEFAFNTAAAFSPTDVLPLTPRMKMMMTVQSIISLITVIAVGARAINILGS